MPCWQVCLLVKAGSNIIPYNQSSKITFRAYEKNNCIYGAQNEALLDEVGSF